MSTPDTGQADGAEPATRPMGAIYAAVIIVEVVTLAALWWFQSTFGRG